MFEQDKNNDLFTGGMDLGSSPSDGFGSFDFFNEGTNIAPEVASEPQAAEEGQIDLFPQTETQMKSAEENTGQVELTQSAPAETPKETQELSPETKSEEKENDGEAIQQGKTESSGDAAKAADKNGEKVSTPFDEALAKADEAQAQDKKNSLIDKLPVFDYSGAKEDIVDTSKTFDQLRIEKAEDFPELDDKTAVKWTVTYAGITKTVVNADKTTIASFKKKIEDSKEFLTALQKAKGDIVCKISPKITAKQKGILCSYKGVAKSLADAKASGKLISLIPSDDGAVYDVRINSVGTFSAVAENTKGLDRIRAGFIPALPKIPYSELSKIIAFFKSYVKLEQELEAYALIYWSFADSKYYVYVPEQTVSKARVSSSLPEIDEEKFPLVMEIHSHNTMPACFSPTDNKDEKATRIYTVVGRLDKVFPDITTRVSVGGTFVEIDPSIVFEGFSGSFPESWRNAVTERNSYRPYHKEDAI